MNAQVLQVMTVFGGSQVPQKSWHVSRHFCHRSTFEWNVDVLGSNNELHSSSSWRTDTKRTLEEHRFHHCVHPWYWPRSCLLQYNEKTGPSYMLWWTDIKKQDFVASGGIHWCHTCLREGNGSHGPCWFEPKDKVKSKKNEPSPTNSVNKTELKHKNNLRVVQSSPFYSYFCLFFSANIDYFSFSIVR